MTFEAGPWHCFGNELLDRLLQLIQQNNQMNPTPSAIKPLNVRNSQGGLSFVAGKSNK